MRSLASNARLKSRLAWCALVALLASCSVEIPEDGKDLVSGIVTEPGVPYSVEYKIYQLPAGLRQFNHLTYGLQFGKDGYLYLGAGDNHEDMRLLRFDTRSAEMEDLGGVLAALPAEVRQQGNFGKFHVGPYQANDGSIYFISYTRERWEGEPAGRLFRYEPGRGIVDLGPTPGNRGAYFMHGDDRFNRLYAALSNSHFVIYDLATGTWQDKGRFSSRPPFIGLTDPEGRLYMYSYDGKGENVPGPSTITRYDPRTDVLETSWDAPPTLWVGAVTPDHDLVYTTGYERGEVYRWRLSDWPDYTTEKLGRIDPGDRAVDSNDLSLKPGTGELVLAGTVVRGAIGFRESIHGVWIYRPGNGRKYFAARLNEALTESYGVDTGKLNLYWTNANTVDEDGWIYIGIHTLPSDQHARARLLALKIHDTPGSP